MQCDETYDNAEWVSWINQCFDDLTPVAKNLVNVSGKSVVITSGKGSITLSADADLKDAHEIKTVYYTPTGGKKTRLRKLSQGSMYSKGWKLENDKLVIQSLGTEASGTVDVGFYKIIPHIVYVKTPETFTPSSPPLPLKEQYHGLIVSWLSMKCQQREEEPEDKKDFQNEYMIAKQVFAEDRLKEMEPWLYRQVYQSATQETES